MALMQQRGANWSAVIFEWSFASDIRESARCEGMRMLEPDH